MVVAFIILFSGFSVGSIFVLVSWTGLIILAVGFVFGAVFWWLYTSYKSLMLKENELSLRQGFDRSLNLNKDLLSTNNDLVEDLKESRFKNELYKGEMYDLLERGIFNDRTMH